MGDNGKQRNRLIWADEKTQQALKLRRQKEGIPITHQIRILVEKSNVYQEYLRLVKE